MERYRAETPLEMAKRHVREAEQRIVRLTKRVINMRTRGYDTEQAERLLSNFHDLLQLAHRHLKHEEAIAASALSTKPSLPPQ